MRFARDDRIQEVEKLLRSSRPIPVVVNEAGLSDRDMLTKQQQQLYINITRHVALPIGRGAFTLGTALDSDNEWIGGVANSSLSPMNSWNLSFKSEPIFIPPINLAGRESGASTSIALEPSLLPPFAVRPKCLAFFSEFVE